MRRIIRLSLSVVVAATVMTGLLLTASVYSFFALTDETLIAEIEFDRVGDQSYLAYLRTGDFCTEDIYAVLGDQWRIDAQFLKWHYWATLLGLDSQYRLERLEGRYRSIEDQNVAPTLAHALAQPSAIDIGALSGRLGKLNFLADASYGSSTYHDIDPASVYMIYKTPTGILTRMEPRLTAQRDGEALLVEVTRGCGDDAGLVKRSALWVNRVVDRQD